MSHPWCGVAHGGPVPCHAMPYQYVYVPCHILVCHAMPYFDVSWRVIFIPCHAMSICFQEIKKSITNLEVHGAIIFTPGPPPPWAGGAGRVCLEKKYSWTTYGLTMDFWVRSELLDSSVFWIRNGFLDSRWIPRCTIYFWIRNRFLDSRWISGFTVSYWIHDRFATIYRVKPNRREQ